MENVVNIFNVSKHKYKHYIGIYNRSVYRVSNLCIDMKFCGLKETGLSIQS